MSGLLRTDSTEHAPCCLTLMIVPEAGTHLGCQRLAPCMSDNFTSKTFWVLSCFTINACTRKFMTIWRIFNFVHPRAKTIIFVNELRHANISVYFSGRGAFLMTFRKMLSSVGGTFHNRPGQYSCTAVNRLSQKCQRV